MGERGGGGKRKGGKVIKREGGGAEGEREKERRAETRHIPCKVLVLQARVKIKFGLPV